MRYAPEGSPPRDRSRSRTAARRRRRNRLRTTAGPTLRPMAYATRTSPAAGRCTTVIGPRRARRPSRRRASNVARSPIRPIRPRVERGPSAAGSGRSPDRRASSCGDGSRDVSTADACWAGMCASPCASSATRPPRIVSGASGGNRNDPATNTTRGVGAPAPVPGTTVEGGGTQAPTWAGCAQAVHALIHIIPRSEVPSPVDVCGRPWSGLSPGATLRPPRPAGRGPSAGEAPSSTGGRRLPDIRRLPGV